MNRNNLYLLVGILLIVSIFGIWMISRQNTPSTATVSIERNKQEVLQPTIKSTAAGKLQTIPPTMVPLRTFITKIDDQIIIISDKENGEMQLTKDPNKVKVFIRNKENLVPATISDLKVGQSITLNIVPKVSAEVIIEP